eukprot:12735054-Ditylum_brightwellii.AAC.1
MTSNIGNMSNISSLFPNSQVQHRNDPPHAPLDLVLRCPGRQACMLGKQKVLVHCQVALHDIFLWSVANALAPGLQALHLGAVDVDHTGRLAGIAQHEQHDCCLFGAQGAHNGTGMPGLPLTQGQWNTR